MTNRRVAYTGWILWTKGWFISRVGQKRGGTRFHTTQHRAQLKSYKLFIAKILHLRFLDHVWPTTGNGNHRKRNHNKGHYSIASHWVYYYLQQKIIHSSTRMNLKIMLRSHTKSIHCRTHLYKFLQSLVIESSSADCLGIQVDGQKAYKWLKLLEERNIIFLLSWVWWWQNLSNWTL